MSVVDTYVESVLTSLLAASIHKPWDDGTPYFCQFPESPRPSQAHCRAVELRCSGCVIGVEAELRLTQTGGALTGPGGPLYGDDRLEALAKLRHLAQASDVKPLPRIEEDR